MRVPPAPPDDGYVMLAMRGLQELERKARIPLFLHFLDLQKAYDPVDRTLIWKVLARSGVRSQKMEVIHQLHDGMRACVRNDDVTRNGSRWHRGCVTDASKAVVEG